MGSENEPAKLLLPYLQRADELQKHELLVAYYCRLYAMERGLKIPQKERTKTTNALLVSLMNQLEKDKKALQLGPEDNLYVEGFALNVFAKADKQDRAGRADINTAKTFYAASIFFEILNQFGPLQPDIEQKQKYAAWKAADIRKALKEGRKPEPGPPGDDKDLSIPPSTPSAYDLGTSETNSINHPEPGADASPQFHDNIRHPSLTNIRTSPPSYPNSDYPYNDFHPSPLNGQGSTAYSQASPLDRQGSSAFSQAPPLDRQGSSAYSQAPPLDRQGSSAYSQAPPLDRQESSAYSQAPPLDRQGTSAYSQAPPLDKQESSAYSQAPPLDRQGTSAYSQAPPLDRQESSAYSQAPPLYRQEGSAYSQPPLLNRQESSTYSQAYHPPYPHDSEQSLPRNYPSHETPSQPYSFPNFQSYPSFSESSLPSVPSHYPSYHQGPDASYSHQTLPPVSGYQSVAQYTPNSGNESNHAEPAPTVQTFHYDSNYQPPAEKVAEAHKAARFAVGALAFDDVSVAVEHLRKSLELLTNPSAKQ